MTNIPFDLALREEAKMLPDKRRFYLKPMEGKTALTSSGAPDPRLFTGENNLYGILDKDSGLWFLRYDNGDLPGGLQQKWTTFGLMADHVRAYFAGRNVEVTQ